MENPFHGSSYSAEFGLPSDSGESVHKHRDNTRKTLAIKRKIIYGSA